MLSISGTNITITRGDSAYISVEIKDKDGNAYKLDPVHEIVRVQVRAEATSSKILFEDEIEVPKEGNLLLWHIKPEDTMDAQMGKIYEYDMQLEIYEDEAHMLLKDVFTFIPTSSFEIVREVTR